MESESEGRAASEKDSGAPPGGRNRGKMKGKEEGTMTLRKRSESRKNIEGAKRNRSIGSATPKKGKNGSKNDIVEALVGNEDNGITHDGTAGEGEEGGEEYLSLK